MGGHADRCEGPACLLGEMGSTEGLGRGVTMIQLTTKNESAGSGLQQNKGRRKGTRERWAVPAVPGTKEGARALF